MQEVSSLLRKFKASSVSSSAPKCATADGCPREEGSGGWRGRGSETTTKSYGQCNVRGYVVSLTNHPWIGLQGFRAEGNGERLRKESSLDGPIAFIMTLRNYCHGRGFE